MSSERDREMSGGDPKGTGYGAGGLGAGADRAAGSAPDPWDAPGVTPDGRRTGASTDLDVPEAVTSGVATEVDQQPVATGERHDGSLEPDSNDQMRARFTHKPAGPLPHQLSDSSGSPPEPKAGPPVQDVAVLDDEPSVWDARPPSR